MQWKRKIRSFLRDTDGAVTMEYVLLCVLLAAGSVMMIITFSRSVARQFALASYAMAGHDPELIKETKEAFQEAQKEDAVVGSVYSDYMHGEKVNEKGK